MEQKCENCKWKEAPCYRCECETYRNNVGLGGHRFKDHWTPAKPWEDKWVVPEGCGIVGCHGDFYYGFSKGSYGYKPTKWNKFDGVSYDTVRDLIPKTPPIEETEEYKAFAAIYSPGANKQRMLLRFLELKKIFNLELKQAD